MLSPASSRDIPLPLIEGGLTLIAVAIAFLVPRLASPWFASVERILTQLAHRKSLSVLVVGLTALLLRLAILPICPIPLPFVPDDFSFMLAADTFAHGRLTNPTPAMWMHFETIHVNMNPSYMSMYFPAEGLVLAAGKVLFGHPWFGLLIICSLMCAAICWMLQAWLPPTWALLGGMIAVLHLGLFSYWINSYSGAGSICGLGGALVLGALPRLIKTTRKRDALLMAIGIILLAITRPYEGLLVCLPAAVLLGRWMLFDNKRPALGVLVRRAALPVALIVGAGAWMGYYDLRAFGKATTLPYTINRATYAVTPYFAWQPRRPDPVYRHEVMRTFYTKTEYRDFEKEHTLPGFLSMTMIKVGVILFFFAGTMLLPPLIMIRRVFLDRRIRFLVICVCVFAAGMVIQIYCIPHYVAPFTCVFYAIGLQAMRHLRAWKPGDAPVGKTIVRLTVMSCVVLGGLRLAAVPLHFQLQEWPATAWILEWYGPGPFGGNRAATEAKLEAMPGKQLVIVRYTSDHNPFDEWVYNSADIDGSKVIWAREMTAEHNSELLQYYKDRHVWLVEPDTAPRELSNYAPLGKDLALARLSDMNRKDWKQEPSQ